MFICNILLEVTYGSNKEDFYITILNSFSVKAYRFLPNMLSMPCFFLRTKPHMPLVHHKQQKQSIKHRHCGVTAALFLTSGKAPACLISMIYKEWTLQDLLLPRKCLKSNTQICAKVTQWKQSPDTGRSNVKTKAILQHTAITTEEKTFTFPDSICEDMNCCHT